MARATDGVGILLLGHIGVTGTASRHPETEGAPTCCVRVVPFVTGTADVKVQRTQGSLVGKWRDRAAAPSLVREAYASPLIGHHGGFLMVTTVTRRVGGWRECSTVLLPEQLKRDGQGRRDAARQRAFALPIHPSEPEEVGRGILREADCRSRKPMFTATHRPTETHQGWGRSVELPKAIDGHGRSFLDCGPRLMA